MSEYKKMQVIFQTLSDANRLKILHCLCNCECCAETQDEEDSSGANTRQGCFGISSFHDP